MKQSKLAEIFETTKDRERKVWYMRANDEEERWWRDTDKIRSAEGSRSPEESLCRAAIDVPPPGMTVIGAKKD